MRELWHISTDTLFMNGQQLAPTKPPKLPPTRLIESDSWNATRNVLILLIWPKEGTRLKHNNTPAERALEIGNTHRRVYTVHIPTDRTRLEKQTFNYFTHFTREHKHFPRPSNNCAFLVVVLEAPPKRYYHTWRFHSADKAPPIGDCM